MGSYFRAAAGRTRGFFLAFLCFTLHTEAQTNTNGAALFSPTPGAMVRVKCSAPAVDLNRVRLVEMNGSNVIVETASLERFVLPAALTVVGEPITWQVTSTVSVDDPAARRRKWWTIFGVVCGVMVAGAGGGFWMWRRRQADRDFNDLLGLDRPTNPGNGDDASSGRDSA